LHQSLLHYAHQFMIQMVGTALCNGRHKIEERSARWLLLADDRLDNHEIPLTHEFLGVMLGTARPGITIALQEPERRDGLPIGGVLSPSLTARGWSEARTVPISPRTTGDNVRFLTMFAIAAAIRLALAFFPQLGVAAFATLLPSPHCSEAAGRVD
jgi:hypothetical protein